MSCWEWLFGKNVIDEVENGNLVGNASLRNAAVQLLSDVGGMDGKGGEIGRLTKIDKSIFRKVKITKGINDRSEKLKQGEGEIKKLGKVTMLSQDWQRLNQLVQKVTDDKEAKNLVANLKEFLNIHVPSIARDMHHKRRSTFDQIRNKLLFWGVFAVVGIVFLPAVLALFKVNLSLWTAGLIGAGIGQIVNFTPLGKFFGGQSASQGKWESLAKHFTFSAPTDSLDKVKQAIYERMQKTLPWFFLQSSGDRTTTAKHLIEFVRNERLAAAREVKDDHRIVAIVEPSSPPAQTELEKTIDRDVTSYEVDRTLRVRMGGG